MLPIYIIELHPTKKLYYFYKDYADFIFTTVDIEQAKTFNTYSEALKEVAEIVKINDEQDFYISILEIYISLND